MFPIGDQNVRGARLSIVTWTLIGINVFVFFFEVSLNQSALQSFVYEYGVVPAKMTQGEDVISLLTSMFLHGGWLHLISNMLYLAIFGNNIEAVMGRVIYPIFYFLGGMAASGVHIFFNVNSSIPSVGASGAIAAVLGAYIVMFPHSKVKVLMPLGFFLYATQVTAVAFLGFWAIMQFFNGFASLGTATAQTAGVAWWAHIGGFVFGLAGGFVFRHRAEDLDLTN